MSKLRWLSAKGDSEILINNDQAVDAATKKFNELSEQGFSAFQKATDGSYHPVKTLDPEHDTLMIPSIAGG